MSQLSKSRRHLVLGAALSAVSRLSHSEHRPNETVLYVNPNDYRRYVDFVGTNGSLVSTRNARSMTRHVAEMILFLTAAASGGYTSQITYRPYKNETSHRRSIAEMSRGNAPADPFGIFANREAYSEDLVCSEPIISPQQLKIGIYTHESRIEVTKLKKIESIRSLRYTVSEDWTADRKILTARGLTLIESGGWTSALNMIKARRADVIAQPFTSQKQNRLGEDGLESEFVHIHGWFIDFESERRYAFSRAHPEGLYLMNCINKGLKELKNEGFTDTLWRSAGVINEYSKYYNRI